jgi:hypothetical protein
VLFKVTITTILWVTYSCTVSYGPPVQVIPYMNTNRPKKDWPYTVQEEKKLHSKWRDEELSREELYKDKDRETENTLVLL